MKEKSNNNSAFSMVELAIVLVVVGLIIAAVAGSQALIKRAEAQAIITDIGNYTESIETFSNKYGYLPGDMPEDVADRFFATSSDAHPGSLSTTDNGVWDSNEERDLVWAQLAETNMIGGFTFQAVTGGIATVGSNRPSTKITGAGWDVSDSETLPLVAIDIEEVLIIGGNGPSNRFLDGAFVSTDHHIIVDAKIDKPNSPLNGNYVVLDDACINNAGSGNYFYAEDGGNCRGAYTKSNSRY